MAILHCRVHFCEDIGGQEEEYAKVDAVNDGNRIKISHALCLDCLDISSRKLCACERFEFSLRYFAIRVKEGQ